MPSPVKVIGKETFQYCEQLVEVELCRGLERIDDSAFDGCTNLKHTKIPSTVKVIGKYAFYDCKDWNTLSRGHVVAANL